MNEDTEPEMGTAATAAGADNLAKNPAGEQGAQLVGLLAKHLERLEAQSARWKDVTKVLARWTKPDAITDFARLEKEFALLQDKFGQDLDGEFGLGEVVAAMGRHLSEGKTAMRKELGRKLKEASGQAGLKLKVISREDPVELRIPPFAVRLDLDAGKAQLLFARQVLATTPATAGEILKGHGALAARMQKGFDPERFFTACYEAYKMGLAVSGGKRGDRLELVDFLGHLAMRMQGKAFFVDPTDANFRGYSRGQFAFDVNQLRLARGLTQEGKRMNFGVATGTTATKKARVIYMEDEYGQGEYKLNIYFTEGA